ncbi:MAG: hypothetical protein J07HQW2_03818 [Haloquadratum walsbyi J07HQW2]|uniref:Uncharacterized protein n=1 Tax=Haloquadratum walsbyi J07HQW2 TaxID=1238425 RepID=U1PU47_9EURY|nr:MAG: hypothetical protein J07HQW2_03818 [Haloquadratum walsbyi J07HQW2]
MIDFAVPPVTGGSRLDLLTTYCGLAHSLPFAEFVDPGILVAGQQPANLCHIPEFPQGQKDVSVTFVTTIGVLVHLVGGS